RLADAGGGEHTLTIDLHHAGTAVAIGPVAGLRQVAEVGDVRSRAPRGLPDGLARQGRDLAPVEREADRLLRLAHRAAPAAPSKKLRIERTGLGAAWPRPQMEASRIAVQRSSIRLRSQSPASIRRTILSVPARQGVHWPQLSARKNRMRFSATALRSSLSESTMTAWLPTKAPCVSSTPKSSGTSASAAGRIPPEAPPGR